MHNNKLGTVSVNNKEVYNSDLLFNYLDNYLGGYTKRLNSYRKAQIIQTVLYDMDNCAAYRVINSLLTIIKCGFTSDDTFVLVPQLHTYCTALPAIVFYHQDDMPSEEYDEEEDCIINIVDEIWDKTITSIKLIDVISAFPEINLPQYIRRVASIETCSDVFELIIELFFWRLQEDETDSEKIKFFFKLIRQPSDNGVCLTDKAFILLDENKAPKYRWYYTKSDRYNIRLLYEPIGISYKYTIANDTKLKNFISSFDLLLDIHRDRQFEDFMKSLIGTDTYPLVLSGNKPRN